MAKEIAKKMRWHKEEILYPDKRRHRIKSGWFNIHVRMLMENWCSWTHDPNKFIASSRNLLLNNNPKRSSIPWLEMRYYPLSLVRDWDMFVERGTERNLPKSITTKYRRRCVFYYRNYASGDARWYRPNVARKTRINVP